MIDDYLEQTLEQLEVRGPINATSDSNDSLVKKVNTIRKKRLIDLTVEDLSLLLRQQFSLDFVIPLCIEKLKNNILIETERSGNYLLVYLIKVDKDFWINNKDLYDQVIDTINSNMNAIINPELNNPVELDSYIEDKLPDILKFYERFKNFY